MEEEEEARVRYTRLNLIAKHIAFAAASYRSLAMPSQSIGM